MPPGITKLLLVVAGFTTAIAVSPLDAQQGPPADRGAGVRGDIEELRALVEAQSDRIAELESRLACFSDASSVNELIIEGCNVHVRNGGGATATTNGLGNLVVGYGENPLSEDRTGSHNLVIGAAHGYSAHSGLIAGTQTALLIVQGEDVIVDVASDVSIESGSETVFNTGRSSLVLDRRDITVDAGDVVLKATGTIDVKAGTVDINGTNF